MNPHQQAIHDLRTKGNGAYFALDTLTDKELVCALRMGDYNTSLENVALVECILERMAR